MLVIGWAVVNLAFEGASFALPISPEAMQSVAAATIVAKLFAALVLFMLSADEDRQRLRWVAGGIGTIVVGYLAYQYLQPLLVGAPGPNILLYENVVRWTTACALLAVGLLPVTPPRFSPRLMLAVLAVFGALYAVAIFGADLLPVLIQAAGTETEAASSETSRPGLTGWW